MSCNCKPRGSESGRHTLHDITNSAHRSSSVSAACYITTTQRLSMHMYINQRSLGSDKTRALLHHVDWLLVFYILATSTVIAGCVPIVTVCTDGDFIVLPHCEIKPLASLLQYPTQSYYPGTELISPCFILSMLSARLRSEKYQFDKLLL